MSYCQNCGNEIGEGAQFCSRCGKSQSTVTSTGHQVPKVKGLHCPKCRSTALSPIVETEISGGYSLNHSVTRKTGVSAFDFKNTHRNYWMCGSCGHKFRNIQNLDEEIAVYEKGIRSIIATSIFFAILFLIPFLFGGSVSFFGIIVLTVAMVFFYFLFKRKIDTLEGEKNYLQEHCFD